MYGSKPGGVVLSPSSYCLWPAGMEPSSLITEVRVGTFVQSKASGLRGSIGTQILPIVIKRVKRLAYEASGILVYLPVLGWTHQGDLSK